MSPSLNRRHVYPAVLQQTYLPRTTLFLYRQDQEYLLQAIRFLVQNSFLEGDTATDTLWFPEEAAGIADGRHF